MRVQETKVLLVMEDGLWSSAALHKAIRKRYTHGGWSLYDVRKTLRRLQYLGEVICEERRWKATHEIPAKDRFPRDC